MHFIAPALLKDEHRRVHYQINEHTAAVTQLLSRVQAQLRVLTETVAQLDSAQIDRLAALSVLPGGAPLARAYRKQRTCRPGQAKLPPGTNLEGAS